MVWVGRVSAPTVFPYTTLFRSGSSDASRARAKTRARKASRAAGSRSASRSEEHTSELQSRLHIVSRLLLDKKNGFHILLRRLSFSLRSPKVMAWVGQVCAQAVL